MSQVPVLVTGTVALGVPVIAALWARSTQGKQLEHDREIRDLQELRGLLDTAADRLWEVLAADLRVKAVRRWHQRFSTDDAGKLTPRAIDIQHEMVQARQEASLRVSAIDDRLTMRLGREAPVAVLFRASAFVAGKLALVADEQEDSEQWKVLTDGLRNGRTEFVNEATNLIASRLPPQRKPLTR